MKRVKEACFYQTLIFVLDPNISKDEAILNETYNEDGTVEIEVKKAVSGYPTGKYF